MHTLPCECLPEKFIKTLTLEHLSEELVWIKVLCVELRLGALFSAKHVIVSSR